MKESPSTYLHLFMGYSAIWLLIAGYVFSLGKRISTLEKSSQKSGSTKDKS
jgi:CcmD family protein